MRLLTTVPKWWRHEAPDLTAEFYDEILRLAPFFERVTVITERFPSEAGRETTGNVEIRRVRTTRLPRLQGFTKIIGYLWQLLLLVLSGEVNVVYIRQLSPPDLLIGPAGKILGIPVVQCVPGTWLFLGRRTMRRRLYRWLLKLSVACASKILLYSPLMTADVRKIATTLDVNRVDYVRNGVDVVRFKPGAPSPAFLRSFNVPSDSPIALYAGRIAPLKGVEEVIQAAKLVVNRIPKVRFILAGTPEEEYLAQLKKLIGKLQLENVVTYVGPVANRDMPDLYRAAYVFVYMSRGGEGIPRAILEAMASAKPIIATPVAGIPEVVQDNQTGFLVPMNDPTQLAERLCMLLADRGLARRIGDNARSWVQLRHSWDVIAPKLRDALKTAGRG